VKPLYGHQEQALRGYNPTKHGRPSHVYQTYFIAAIGMVLARLPRFFERTTDNKMS
jgi:hypothetical protein